jgi:hypothetical protein
MLAGDELYLSLPKILFFSLFFFPFRSLTMSDFEEQLEFLEAKKDLGSLYFSIMSFSFFKPTSKLFSIVL